MRKAVKIGLIQVKRNAGDGLEERWAMLSDLGESCFRAGADIVLYPEFFQYPNFKSMLAQPEKLRETAEKWKNTCACLARKYGAYLAAWDLETDADGSVYNSSYILDRAGNEVGRYRKVHLTYDEQAAGLKNGGDFPVFDLDIGKVGIMICFDNYWPESSRILALKGAELILYPLYGDTLTPQWELKLRARSVDNHVYIASCQLSDRYNIAYTGLINPEGFCTARLESAPAWMVAEADLGRPVITSTGNNGITEDIGLYLKKCRMPDSYGEIAKRVEAPSWDDVFIGKSPI